MTRNSLSPVSYHRLGLAAAVLSALFLVLSAGALGIIGDGGRPDRMYVAVLAVGVLGAVAARLRSPGMALTLLAMAATMALVSAGALISGVHRDEGGSVVDIIGITAMFVMLFAGSAWLFWRAAPATQRA